MIASKNAILKDLVISPKLQKEIDIQYLIFIISALTVETNKLTKNFPYQDWFAKEIWKISENLWPGIDRSQQVNRINELLSKFKKEEIKGE